MKKLIIEKFISLVLVMTILVTTFNGIPIPVSSAEETDKMDKSGFTYTSDGTSVTITGNNPDNNASLFYGIEHGGHYYGISTESLSWQEAKIACETNGGYLVSINTAEEQSAVENLLHFSSEGNKWIGAYKADGQWKWVDGNTFEFSNWKNKEPDDSADYARICYTNSSSDFTWEDSNASLSYYICEWEQKPAEEIFRLVTGELIIPNEINGIPVTTIKESAFKNKKYITSVVIPEGVTTIEDDAFCNCTSLKSVVIPSSVKSIGAFAFYGCRKLTNVTIPNGVTSLGSYVFGLCDSLVNITIPGSVNSIGEKPFYYCTSLINITVLEDNSTYSSEEGVLFNKDKTEIVFFPSGKSGEYVIPNSVNIINSNVFDCCDLLTSIVIGEGVTYIEEGAFNDCSSLTSITIGSNVSNISSYAFLNCNSLANILVSENNTIFSSEGGVLFNNDINELIYCIKSKSGEYVIPNSVTSIGENAFADCGLLTNLTVPNNVTSIGGNAFANCSSLESITIESASIDASIFYGCFALSSITLGSEVQSISPLAFSECYSLAGLTVSDSNENYLSEDGVLFNKNKTELLYCVNGKIGEYIIPNSVTNITDYAFSGCSLLTSVTIPEGVTNIAGYAFSDCSSLTSITIPDSVTNIGNRAFVRCNALTSVTIGSGVASIGLLAFDDCDLLTNITISDNNNNYSSEDGVLFNKNKTVLIDCLDNKVGFYEIPSSVKSISAWAFYYCESLTKVTIPEGITSIGDYAFDGCSALTTVTIPSSVTNIGNYAFAYCESLKNVTIIKGVGSIGSNAFAYCESLISVTIPEGIKEIGSNAFGDCTSLTNLIINNGVTSIPKYLVDGCKSLKRITIPNSVTSIDSYAFRDCSELSEVYYTGTSQQWNAITISTSGNNKLTEATLYFNHKHNPEHIYACDIIPSTSREEGYNLYTCTVCGDTYKNPYIVDMSTLNGAARFTAVEAVTEWGITSDVIGLHYATGEAGVTNGNVVDIPLDLSGYKTMTITYRNGAAVGDECADLALQTNDYSATIGMFDLKGTGNWGTTAEASIDVSAVTAGSAVYHLQIQDNATNGCWITGIKLTGEGTGSTDPITPPATGNAITAPSQFVAGTTNVLSQNIEGTVNLTSGTYVIDLAGYVWEGQLIISGTADVTVIDSSANKTGKINSTFYDAVEVNSGTFVAEGIKVIGGFGSGDALFVSGGTVVSNNSILCAGKAAIDVTSPSASVTVNGGTFANFPATASTPADERNCAIEFRNNASITLNGDINFEVSRVICRDGHTNSFADSIMVGEDVTVAFTEASRFAIYTYYQYSDMTYTYGEGESGGGGSTEPVLPDVSVEIISPSEIVEGTNILMSNIFGTKSFTSGKYIIDLAGYEWDGQIFVSGTADVTIIDSSKAQTGLIDSFYWGDAIDISGGKLTLDCIEISGSEGAGDAIFVSGGIVSIKGCKLSSGKAAVNITSATADVVVEDTTFANFDPVQGDDSIDLPIILLSDFSDETAIMTTSYNEYADPYGRNCAIEFSNNATIMLKGNNVFENNIIIRKTVTHTKSWTDSIVVGENVTITFDSEDTDLGSSSGNSYKSNTITYTYDEDDRVERIGLSDATVELEYTSVYYEGSPLQPNVILKYNGKTYNTAEELKITYVNNNKVGTATVIVEGIKNFIGTVELYFEISYEVIPKQIVNVVAIGEIGKISLSWGQSSEVNTDKYNIYRKAQNEDTYQLIKTIVGRNIIFYEDTDVNTGKTYSYYVTGVGLYGAESKPSLESTATVLADQTAPVILKLSPVAASCLSGRVTLSANVTDNVGVVKVAYFYTIDNGENWAVIGETANSSFSIAFDTSVINSKAVKVKAIAYDVEGNESEPFMVVYSLDNEGPEKVTGLSAAVVSSKITLSWNDVDANDAAYFILQTKTNGQWEKVADKIKTLGYSITGLQPNTEYVYRVACVDVYGNTGEYSDEFIVKTDFDTTAPVITKQSPDSARYNSAIEFSATAKDDCDIEKIEIQISTDLNVWTTISSTVFATRNYQQTYKCTISLSEYAEGSLFVRAVATDFSGNISDTSLAAPYTEYIIDRMAPKAPENVTATGNTGYITISWDMGNEIDLNKYYVYRSETVDGDYVMIASNLTSLNYHDRAVETDKNYYYKVKVSDTCKNMSEFSSVVSATMTPDDQKPEIISISSTYQQKISNNVHTISVAARDNNKLERIVVEYRIGSEQEYTQLAINKDINEYYKSISVSLPIENLNDGDVICVRAYAVDAEGLKSEYVTAEYTCDKTPAMIESFEISLDAATVYLDWSDCRDNDLAGFRIYRSVDGINFSLLGTRSVGKTGLYNFVDTISAKESNTYIYKLESVDKLGNTATWIRTVDYTYVYVNQIPTPVISIPEYIAVGVEEIFDASKSTDDIAIINYLWDFGDGTSSTEIKPVKSFSAIGTYTVKLSVTDNEGITSTITKEVEVKERDLLGTLQVRVVDEKGKALPYVPVYFDLGSSNQKIIYTDASGVAKIQMLGGTHTIGMYTAGYLPVKKDVVVLANAERTVTLSTVEEDIITGEFEVTRMEFDEIINAGIDVYDPANQNLYSATVRVTYGSTPMNIRYIRTSDSIIDYVITDRDGKPISGFVNDNGEERTIANITFIPSRDDEEVVAILDIPASTSYLKEFFDVRLHIVNNASSEFVLENNEIVLNVPDGMTLMDSVEGGYEKSNIVEFPSIKGSETKTIAWVLRGDEAGEYSLSADYTGTLAEFNELVTAKFETDEPIKVYGLRGVKFRILTADEIHNDTLYFNIELENERDIDINMPTIGLTDKIHNVTESVLRNNPDGDFLSAAYILNAYIQTENGEKQYLPVSYDENGRARTPLEILAPGQKLVYEYVAYNAINYAGIGYFQDAVIKEFEGLVENIEIGSFHKNFYSFNDYTDKLDTILDGTDASVNNAHDYIMKDKNYYYISEANGITAGILESLYNLGDVFINFDLDSITQEDERNLIKTLLLSLLAESSVIEQSNDLILHEYNKATLIMLNDLQNEILDSFEGSESDADKIKDAFKDFCDNSMDFMVTYKTEGIKGFKHKVDQDLAAKIGDNVNIDENIIAAYNDIKAFKKVITVATDVFDTVFSSFEEERRDYYYFAMLKLQCNEKVARQLLDKVIDATKEGAHQEYLKMLAAGAFPAVFGFDLFLQNGLGLEPQTLIYQEALEMRKDLDKSIEEYNSDWEYVKKLIDNALVEGAEFALEKIVTSAIASTPLILITLGFNVLDGYLGWGNYVQQHDALQVYAELSKVYKDAYVDNSKNRGSDDDFYTMLFLRAVCEMRLKGEAQFKKFITDYSEGKYRLPLNDRTILEKMSCEEDFSNLDAWADDMQYKMVHSRDVLFNIESISEMETPRAPEVSLDYDTLQTVQTFSSEYEYCFADGEWKKCNNEPISFEVRSTPSIIRVRKAASDTNFVGESTTLRIFARKDLSKLITAKFDGVNYLLDNLSSKYKYQVVFTNDLEAKVDWHNAQIISGSEKTVEICGVGEYSNIIIRSCKNADLYETTSNPLTLTVTKKQMLNLLIDGSGTVTQTSDTGCYFNGDSVDLVATANLGCDFVGWYINGVCVSEDEHYIVEMAEDLQITAQFTGVKIKGISIEELPTKLNYYEGEALDCSGLKVLVIYTDNTTTYAEQFAVQLSNNTVGKASVIITYSGYSASYDITISHSEGDWITINKATIFNEGLKIKRCSVCREIIATEVLPMIIDESGITVDTNEDLIYDIPEVLFDAETFINHYADKGCIVKVLDADAKESTRIKTGGYIRCADKKYTTVVYGDTTGDGDINLFDLLSMLDHINGVAPLEGAYKKAGMVEDEADISIFDMFTVLDYVNGGESINP